MRPALSDYPHLASGKVRELYRIDDDHLLFVATDRISAFDHPRHLIPDKGRILTAMSVFFFGLVDAPNHLAGPPDDPRIPPRCSAGRWWCGGWTWSRSSASPAATSPVRGLLDLPADRRSLRHRVAARTGGGQQVRRALFTPATKAELGAHDENISFARVEEWWAGPGPNNCGT